MPRSYPLMPRQDSNLDFRVLTRPESESGVLPITLRGNVRARDSRVKLTVHHAARNVKHMEEGFSFDLHGLVTELGYGDPEDVLVSRTRTVLMYQDFVVKVATNGLGALANGYELAASQETDPFIPVAPTRRVDTETVGRVIVMDRVAPVGPSVLREAGCPDWVGYVDCAQVGYLPDGRLVAYDL